MPWQMTVTTAWIAGKRIEAFDETVLSPNIRQLFLQSLCLNTTGTVSPPEVWDLGLGFRAVASSSSKDVLIHQNHFFWTQQVCSTVQT